MTNSSDATDVEPVPTEAEIKTAALDELRAWERFALKRLGQPDARPFRVRHLSDELAFEISAELLVAGNDADAVKSAFSDVRERISHP